ncbi:hypothetical protein N481_07280 [Pseudoalteromonas luteoviolacea S4047-1]|uniref:Uncharacterized protein n=1 Tax=Pseudoalteromonas luteoviolacea S4054 TaxID=1129367 RepID=A0A0F6ADK1_9GAMM|nr:hypothetical protein N479_10135 [Pseudoalteromonas luteoviolacea S4054]KZN76147.1 hypothetical protein N481_07280 [Pseudoalteromonas luteoviolacea S4047-1]
MVLLFFFVIFIAEFNVQIDFDMLLVAQNTTDYCMRHHLKE